MSGYLELSDGGFLGVRDGLVLGRVAGCDVVVDDSKASRRHARLIVEGGVVEIEDLNSSNGTLLNGKPVDRRMMRDGDEVRIGKTVIVYREGKLPGANASSRSSASGSSAGASIFDDEDDLFASDAASPPAAPPSPKQLDEPVVHKSVPPAATPASKQDLLADDLLGDDLLGDDLLGDDPASDDLRSPAPPVAPARIDSPPPARPAAGNVVEFEDEVVEVKKQPPAKRPDPDPVIAVRQPQRAEPSAGGGKSAAGASDDVVGSSQRVLQFSKKAGGKNPLGDDLAQMSGGMRMLVVLAALAIGGGIIYGIMTAMQ